MAAGPGDDRGSELAPVAATAAAPVAATAAAPVAATAAAPVAAVATMPEVACVPGGWRREARAGAVDRALQPIQDPSQF
jgi:hypothetical protein